MSDIKLIVNQLHLLNDDSLSILSQYPCPSQEQEILYKNSIKKILKKYLISKKI